MNRSNSISFISLASYYLFLSCNRKDKSIWTTLNKQFAKVIIHRQP